MTSNASSESQDLSVQKYKTQLNKSKANSPKCRILAAARELFFSKGVAAVTTDMLVKKAKTSKMTLYKYFNNKDEILEQVVTQDVSRIFEPLNIKIESLERYNEVIFEFFDNLVDIIFDPEIVRFDQLMISQALNQADLTQTYYNRSYQPTIDRVEELILMGQKAGYIESRFSPSCLTDTLISSISGLSYTRALHGFNEHIYKQPNKVDSVLSPSARKVLNQRVYDVIELTLHLQHPSRSNTA